MILCDGRQMTKDDFYALREWKRREVLGIVAGCDTGISFVEIFRTKTFPAFGHAGWLHRTIDEMVSEGVLKREWHSTRCDHCGRDDGDEDRYSLGKTS